MFVSKSMTKSVITIGPDADIFEAHAKMSHHQIRHLPVVIDNNRLIGIVTDRDIRSACPDRLFKEEIDDSEQIRVAEIRVSDIMTASPLTVSAVHTIQDVLILLQENRVGAFPVVDSNNRLIGIISVRDLLRAFTGVLGIGEPGTLLGIVVEEKVGQLKKIVDAVTEENVSFGSVLVARYWEPDKRAVFPYLLTQNIAPIKRRLKQLGFKLLEPMEWTLE